MTFQDLQTVLFRIYLNAGYRLAHKIDPDSFVEHLQLDGEHAELIRNLPPREVEQFALELRSKELISMSFAMPTTCKWLQENQPDIIQRFQETTSASRLDEYGVTTARKFASFIRECHDFYDSVPAALPEVARLELLLMAARREQGMRGGRVPDEAAAPPAFSWDSLYWKPSRTAVADFSVDALAVLLRKKEMTDPGEPTWVVISPALSGSMPTILRITTAAYHILDAMEEPLSARQLLSLCQEREMKVSEEALRGLLTRLGNSQVIGSYHVAEKDDRA